MNSNIFSPIKDTECESRNLSKDTDTVDLSVLRSRSRKEPHHLVGAGAGAVTRSGSSSDRSGSDNGKFHGCEFKMTQNITV
jgi:hypothetical protein